MPKKKPKKKKAAAPSETGTAIVVHGEVVPEAEKKKFDRDKWKWKPGQSGNPKGKPGNDFNRLRLLAIEGSETAMLQIITDATDPEPEDPRLRFEAGKFVIERAWGRVADLDKMPPLSADSGRPDLSKLTRDELLELQRIVRKASTGG